MLRSFVPAGLFSDSIDCRQMPEVRRDATCRLFSHEHPHFVKSIESGKPDAFASHNRRDCSILGRDLTNHHRVAAGTAVILTVRSRSNGSAVCRNILSVDFLQPDICTTKCRNFRSALTHGRPPIKTQAEVWAPPARARPVQKWQSSRNGILTGILNKS